MNAKFALLIFTATTLLVHGMIAKAGIEERQNHADILQAAKQFLLNHEDIRSYSDKDIQMGHLDPRLSLRVCGEPLQTYLAPGARTSGKTTVGVRCNAPKAWALYVPATVNLYQQVFETAANLPKGHIIRENDVTLIKRNLSKLNRGFYTDKNQLIGKQTRRRLHQGRVITPNQVKAPLLVKRGEQVELIAKSASFAVRMSGKAMMDGAQGERIRVKNLSSRRIVEGRVTRAGQVTVLN
jgi:flagella basal body P-ring formation protein FlgA